MEKQVLETTSLFEVVDKKQEFNPIGYNPVTAPNGYTDDEMKKASRVDFSKIGIKKIV